MRFVIDADKIPLSSHAGAWLSGQGDEDAAFKTLITAALITAGDDYELVFTSSPKNADELRKLARTMGLRLSKVGHVETGESVEIITDGKVMTFDKTGHKHF